MMRKRRRRGGWWLRFSLSSLVGLAVVGLGGWRYWTGTIYYSVRQIEQAVKSHDRYLFEKHVDLDHMMRRLMDDYLDVALRDLERQPMGPWEQVGAAVGVAFVQLIKPRLVDEARYAITRGVESGSLEHGDLTMDSSPPLPQDQFGEAMQELENDFPKFKPLTLGKVSVAGGTASVELSGELRDAAMPDEPSTQTLRVRFVRTPERHWRATEIENSKEILRFLQQRQDKRLEQANQAIQKEIGAVVVVIGVSKEQGLNDLGTAKDATLIVTVTNRSSRTVQGLVADVTVNDRNGGELKKTQVQDVQPIPAGETQRKVWSLGLDFSDDVDRSIYDADPSELILKVDVRHLAFADGGSIKLAESLDEVKASQQKTKRRRKPSASGVTASDVF